MKHQHTSADVPRRQAFPDDEARSHLKVNPPWVPLTWQEPKLEAVLPTVPPRPSSPSEDLSLTTHSEDDDTLADSTTQGSDSDTTVPLYTQDTHSDNDVDRIEEALAFYKHKYQNHYKNKHKTHYKNYYKNLYKRKYSNCIHVQLDKDNTYTYNWTSTKHLE
jgi:hypothetical protein